MKENVDKQIESLMDKVIKKSALEQPSFDFTANVMAQVECVEQNITTTYQPLISKRVWVMIFFGFIAFVAYIMFVTKPEDSSWFTAIGIDTENISNLLNGIHPSRIAGYGVGLLAVMLLVQIPLLKNYFDKRILN